ncbi:hypothetical protein [Vogesella amnigena]
MTSQTTQPELFLLDAAGESQPLPAGSSGLLLRQAGRPDLQLLPQADGSLLLICPMDGPQPQHAQLLLRPGACNVLALEAVWRPTRADGA